MFRLFRKDNWKSYTVYDVKEYDERIYFLVFYLGAWAYVDSIEFSPEFGMDS